MDCFSCELVQTDTVLVLLRTAESDNYFKEIAKSLAEGFIIVLKRQLAPYLSGALSNPSRDVINSTLEAPVHNMHSERALGMFDALSKRAHNATTGFLDGKVKCKINKTFNWLMQLNLSKQKDIITFAIKQAVANRKLLLVRKSEIDAAAKLRQVETAQKRDKTERRKIERAIKLDLDKNVEPKTFASFSDETRDIIRQILNKDPGLLQRSINHIWDVEGKDVIFMGSIHSFSSKKNNNFINVEYLNNERKIFLISEFLADIALGDISFQ